MLPDELERASEEASQQRRFIIVSAAAVVLLGLLAISIANWLVSLTSKTGPAAVAAQENIQPAVVRVVDTSDADTASRDAFKQALKVFESDIESRIVAANLPAWNPDTYKDIYALKDQAVSAFGRSEYALALNALKNSRVLAEKTLADWQDKYAAAYTAARNAFHANDADKAGLHIDQALIYKPADADALKLQQRIAILPKIQSLLAAARVAKVENDLAKELEMLEKIIALDPVRTELEQRISWLQQELVETRYAAFIDAGLKAIQAHDIAQARASLGAARALFPARPESRVLSNKISEHARVNALALAIKKADKAILDDDWSAVLDISRQALRENPHNKNLIDKVQSAQKILALSSALADFLKRHQRLASANVAERAEKTLQEADATSHLSRRLMQQADELRVALSQYGTPVEVTVRSDNKTYITIRGVGKVGMTTSKKIRLKPGKYVFEGRRPGYKSKLRTLMIGRDQKTASVEVISDERI